MREPGDSEEARERALQRALDNPMPRDLARRIAEEIEPHTMNVGIKHGEVMIAVHIAFPLIRDYLRNADDQKGSTDQ